MNIWLKELSIEDDKTYFDLLCVLASYPDVYARPVPEDFSYEEYDDFKKVRVRMSNGEDLPESVMPTTTYWVMNEEVPIGYATLKHRIDPNKPGGHFGCCLKKEYQNKGIGSIVSKELSKIAYEDLKIEEVIYTAKNENIQSQKSLANIGANLLYVKDGYHFYSVDLKKQFSNEERKI